MKKKFLLSLIIIASLAFVFGIASVSAATYGKLTYTVSDGKVTITDCNESATGQLVIPDTINGYPVTSIGNFAFFWCDGLTSITIPDSVTSIGNEAFPGCDSLTSITIPDSVTSIGESAFCSCESLTRIVVSSENKNYSSDSHGVLYNKDKSVLIQYPIGKERTEFSIPDNVTSIDYRAFSGCAGLTSITIPDGVTSIGDAAFSHCDGLTSITIPDSVTSIGESAFYSCDSLTGIVVSSENKNYSSDSHGVLYNKDKSVLIQYPIGNERTEFSIPDSVTSIGDSAFSYCDVLTSVTIPDSVTSIGDYAFYRCDSLTSVTIGDSVTSIGNEAFYCCTNLTSITIPDSVTSIGDSAFYYCKQLTTVYYNGSQSKWNDMKIGSYNTPLNKAKKIFFFYVTILDSDGNEISKKKYDENALIDISDIEEKYLQTINLYTDKELTNEYNMQTPITENLTLWTSDIVMQYTVKFIDYDDNIISQSLINENMPILLPENPTREGTQQYTYTFLGWEGYTEGMTVTEDVTFTAKYDVIVNQYTYKFLDEDGSTLKEVTADYGTAIVPPEVSEKTEYYVFDYWQNYAEGIILTGDITFTAVYTYRDYAITVEGASKVINVTYNSNFYIEPQTKKDYLFTGYFTDIDGQGEKITDENGDSLKPYTIADNITVYPYFKSIYLNVFAIEGTQTSEPGKTITQKAVFATDNNAMYLFATLKYPDFMTFQGVSGIDFVEAANDSEKSKDGYKYIDITCLYGYEGENVKKNTKITPFEIEFEVSIHAPVGEALISVVDASLAGENTHAFDSLSHNSITILPKLAESIEITGKDSIDKKEKYTAVVYPDYTSDKSVVWSVDNEEIATISQDGTLTPLKNGTVTITAIAKDAGKVCATKTVSVIAYAKIDSLKFGNGICPETYDPHKKEYTVYVPKDAATITLTPVYTGGVLRPNGSGIWISGKEKTFDLTDADPTIITLNRENVTDNTNSIYTIKVIRFEGTKNTVSEDGNSFSVIPVNIEKGKTVILSLYNGNEFVKTQNAVYDGSMLAFTADEAYTNAKIMVWDISAGIKPVSSAEIISKTEFQKEK